MAMYAAIATTMTKAVHWVRSRRSKRRGGRRSRSLVPAARETPLRSPRSGRSALRHPFCATPAGAVAFTRNCVHRARQDRDYCYKERLKGRDHEAVSTYLRRARRGSSTQASPKTP
jgi:hypothetical protein